MVLLDEIHLKGKGFLEISNIIREKGLNGAKMGIIKQN